MERLLEDICKYYTYQKQAIYLALALGQIDTAERIVIRGKHYRRMAAQCILRYSQAAAERDEAHVPSVAPRSKA